VQPYYFQQSGLMKSISIQIPNDKAATYNVVTFIIAFINLLAFGFAIVNITTGSPKLVIVTGFISSLLAAILLVAKKYGGSSFTRVEILFIVCAVSWIFTGILFPGLILAVFALWGFMTLNKKLVHFSVEGIKYPSFPVK
jgi:hypothetical protein